MIKVINPCICDVHDGRTARAFAKIKFKEEKLSICGVIGPKSNGDCMGSCGQCIEEIRIGSPVDGWTVEMLQKFCDIWDEWHLNDMRPYCEHQKQLGWEKLASKKVTLYQYQLTKEALEAKKEAEAAALNALRKGETFTPSEEQVLVSSLQYFIKFYKKLPVKIAKYYEPKGGIYLGDTGATEEKSLRWLLTNEHPDGILCKPCPICGYKYGSTWRKEKVPKVVIDWLFSLPDAVVLPAWI